MNVWQTRKYPSRVLQGITRRKFEIKETRNTFNELILKTVGVFPNSFSLKKKSTDVIHGEECKETNSREIKCIEKTKTRKLQNNKRKLHLSFTSLKDNRS